MAVPELGHSAARLRQSAPEPEEAPIPAPPEVIHAETAFIVYKLPDGQVVLSADLNAPVSVRRALLNHDIIGMTACVQEDIRLMSVAPTVAHQTVQAIKNEQQAAMQQMQDQQILAQLQRSDPNKDDRVKFAGRHG